MKHFIFILVLINILIWGFYNSYANDKTPICYWELIDQGKYIYPSDLERFNWREIRKLKKQNRNANYEEKFLKLSLLNKDNNTLQQPDKNMMGSASVSMRDPNGEINQISWQGNDLDHIKIPSDNNLVGRYLVGVHIPLGTQDIDNDGLSESIHLCAKHLVSHYKDGGKVGSASVVFFDDAKHMPFEIGPVINTAKSRYGGGRQLSHRSYEMMLKYKNKPLAKSNVTVIALGSMWQKSFITDDNGIFEIVPPDDRLASGDWQNYLYIATHHDQTTNEFYVTTFPVVVYKNRPEWRSKALGFTYWSIIGSVICLMITFGFVKRKQRQESHKMIAFENHKITKNE